jgi:hypothetical protein
MRWNLFALAAAALVAAPALPALAETREEAVAYAFLGLAGDAVLDRGKTHLTWHKASDSPAVFVGHGEGGGKTYDVTFTVTAFDDCDYEIQLAGPPEMVRDGKTLFAQIDLREITSIAVGEFQTTIEGDGYCQTGALNPNCTVVHTPDIFGKLDVEKHARLVSELPIAACKD